MQFMLDLVSFISCLIALVIAIALVYYKMKRPEIQRPYQVNNLLFFEKKINISPKDLIFATWMRLNLAETYWKKKHKKKTYQDEDKKSAINKN